MKGYRLGTTIGFLRYSVNGVKNAGVVIMSDGQSTMGHQKYRLDSPKLHKLGNCGVIAYCGSVALADMSLRGIMLDYELRYYNEYTHVRDALEGQSMIKRAQLYQTYIANMMGDNWALGSLGVGMSSRDSKPFVSRWWGPCVWDVSEPWAVLGSGRVIAREYIETRYNANIDAAAAEELLVAAIRRSKKRDLYSGGRIMMYHISGAKRSDIKYFDLL